MLWEQVTNRESSKPWRTLYSLQYSPLPSGHHLNTSFTSCQIVGGSLGRILACSLLFCGSPTLEVGPFTYSPCKCSKFIFRMHLSQHSGEHRFAKTAPQVVPATIEDANTEDSSLSDEDLRSSTGSESSWDDSDSDVELLPAHVEKLVAIGKGTQGDPIRLDASEQRSVRAVGRLFRGLSKAGYIGEDGRMKKTLTSRRSRSRVPSKSSYTSESAL